MDRELSKNDRRKIKIKRAMPFAIGAVVLCVVLGASKMLMSKSVDESELVVSTVEMGTLQTSASASGKVAPAFEEIITSPISTRILEVYCKAGDSVGVGTPILKLDLQSTETEAARLRDQISMKQYERHQSDINSETKLNDLKMRIEVKEMAVNRLYADWLNERHLDSLGSGTGERVREAEFAYNTGKLELQQMRQQLESERKVLEAEGKVKDLDMNIAIKGLDEMARKLSDAQVRSPRSATLTFVADQIGQKVGEGEQIAILSDLGHFKVDGEISDALADRISVGAPAVVRIGKLELKGVVSNLTPLSRNGVFDFSVRLDDDSHPRLRSGLRAEVFVMNDVREDVSLIKMASFYKGPGEYSLFVRQGDELVKKAIRLGASSYDCIEVVSGVDVGDKVVINDMSDYNNFTKIKIK